MNGARPSIRRSLFAVALCAFAYLYVFPYYAALNNPNENVRFYMTAALVDDGTYAIDGPRARWGWTNDAACVDRGEDGALTPCETRRPAPGVERHYYSVKGPGTSLMGVPGYALYRWLHPGDDFDRTEALWTVRVTGSILPLLLFLFFFYRWLGEFTPSPLLRDSVFLVVGLGSVVWGYAYLFASHSTSAAAAMGSFMILDRARRGGSLGWWSAGLAGALATATSALEYPCFFITAGLCLFSLFALRPRLRILGFVLGALVPVLAVMHFQSHAFGNPLTPGHHFVENAAFRAGHAVGFYGAQTFHFMGALRLLFDERLGLFATSPLLILGLPGVWLLLRRRDTRAGALCLFGASLLLYIFICFMNIWHAGWSIGPRYLVALIPFLAWASLVTLTALHRRRPLLASALALGGLAACMLSAGIPSAYYPHLPDEFDWPLTQLFSVLIAHDYAPTNAGGLLGVFGSLSMLPVALLLLGALLWAGLQKTGSARPLPRLLAPALVAALLLAPHVIIPRMLSAESDPGARRMVAFVCEHWSPEGHDRATRLRDHILALGPASPASDRLRLSELYREEGRDRLADAAARGVGTTRR
ncbi:MAG: hypothetical protein GXP55_17800 [Deltaproteobacteria bacterium]|nr:hypothetical protein [Deltaproteobacteria bacterium]